MKSSTLIAGVLLVVGAHASAAAQQLPPVRQIAPAATMTSEKLGAVSTIRQLSDGRVLVNDIVGRRVLLFDSTLKTRSEEHTSELQSRLHLVCRLLPEK